MNCYRFGLLLAMFFVFGTTTFMESRSSQAVGSLYIVAGEAALLRDYPAPDSGIVTRLQNLDEVEYLDSNASGWWKVRSLRTGTVGWMTADLLSPAPSAAPPAAPAQKASYYANTPFDLRVLPLHSSAVTGPVKLNDRLEKLGASPEGWTKVRNPQNGSRGWLPTRYLSSHRVSSPPQRYIPKKRVKRALPARKKHLEPKAPPAEKARPM